MTDRPEDLAEGPAVEEAPAPEPEAPAEVEYLEHLGDPQYGTEFLSEHRIRPQDGVLNGWETKLTEDVVWTKRPAGRHKGRMLVPVADLPEGMTEELKHDPAFRVTTLKE